MTRVIACIDGSASASAVCDYAGWASTRLNAPLTLLHVLDDRRYPASPDLSGNIGLGSREHLLAELAALDEKRNKLALEQGRIMLAAAKDRVIAMGVSEAEGRQLHGDLVDNLSELEAGTRLLIIGRQGESSDSAKRHVGSQLERVIRIMHRPVLITPIQYQKPKSAMIAFDGSVTAQKGVEMIASSPLLQGLPLHLVMVSPEKSSEKGLLDQAAQRLKTAGFEVRTAFLSGDVEQALLDYQAQHHLDLIVMGAYGHSRIREFFVGSTTTSMLRRARTPLLMLR